VIKPKVLVIEDNDQNLYLITFILEKSGFAVMAARDGRDGIQMACEHMPELILLDIQLPVMNGYEVARQLRLIDALKAIPIVAVTSYAMVGDREKTLEAGCTGYIEKPINPETFVEDVKQFIST
jgi:two-component system cell cycle response regulator DivK